jgi:hypothetical protein
VKYQLVTALVAFAFAGAALASGPYRPSALLGALVAGLTGVGSTLLMGRAATRSARPLQQALLVFVSVFLVRLVLVGSAVAVVATHGWSVIAFVVAFFVPYFVLTALEAAYLHSLRRSGTTA